MTFYRHNPAIGARPGTLSIPPESPAPKIIAAPYSEDAVEFIDVKEVSEIETYLSGSDSVWIDVQGLGDETVLREIGRIFHLGPLALEDAVNVPQRTNEVMKVLTLMASIFIPLTFIAGIYGMNFEYIPELHQRSGYFVVLIVMIGLAGGMLIYFRTRGWLGRSKSRSDSDETIDLP